MSIDSTPGTGEAEGTAAGAAPIRVVHVERDDGVAALVDQYLSLAHPAVELRRVDEVADVADAVREDVDCVVTDHRPPLTDGGDVVAAVRDVDPDVPVVVFSAAPEESVAGTADAVAKRAGLDGLDLLVERVVDAVNRTNRE